MASMCFHPSNPNLMDTSSSPDKDERVGFADNPPYLGTRGKGAVERGRLVGIPGRPRAGSKEGAKIHASMVSSTAPPTAFQAGLFRTPGPAASATARTRRNNSSAGLPNPITTDHHGDINSSRKANSLDNLFFHTLSPFGNPADRAPPPAPSPAQMSHPSGHPMKRRFPLGPVQPAGHVTADENGAQHQHQRQKSSTALDLSSTMALGDPPILMVEGTTVASREAEERQSERERERHDIVAGEDEEAGRHRPTDLAHL